MKGYYVNLLEWNMHSLEHWFGIFIMKWQITHQPCGCGGRGGSQNPLERANRYNARGATGL